MNDRLKWTAGATALLLAATLITTDPAAGQNSQKTPPNASQRSDAAPESGANKPDGNKPDASKPGESKPDGNRPDENKPDEGKSAGENDDKWVRDPLPKANAEWRKVLTPDEFNILRRSGTEKAFSGKYWNSKTPGVYRCAGCFQPLFSSATKFDSGTGWPSFWAPYTKGCLGTKVERKFFVQRIEVHCSRCKGHLGHVFNDGPRPTGLRFCINSPALILDEELPLTAEENEGAPQRK